ncbi:MAG: hypothetical protein OXE94_07440 [Aestuariivita sp.]|nr:hypothetical protein [Aestuariivita sp.]MCY4203103.1 hypothetical protein [Aestuariivita sp.]
MTTIKMAEGFDALIAWQTAPQGLVPRHANNRHARMRQDGAKGVKER